MTISDADGTAVSPRAIARGLLIGPILFRRWFATVVDLLVLMMIVIAPSPLLGAPLYDRTIVLWVALAVLYFPVTEGFWGRTLGKLLTGTVVVDRKGRPPGLLKASLRTLTRLIEVNPVLIGGIPAGLAVCLSKERQRIGDMWADTYVIPAGDLARARKADVQASNAVAQVFD